MSYGDPNNPYAQQPQGGQPAYGYPQQAPQGIPAQGGYAYPQQAYPGGPGYPGAQVPMPGGVKGARVILWILGILSALGGVAVALIGALFASEFDTGSSSSGDAATALSVFFVILGIGLVVLSLWPILTAAKLGKGRGGVRVSGIIYGSIQTLFAVIGLIGNIITLSSAHGAAAGATAFSMVLSLLSLGLGLWIVIGLANSAAGAYFGRPRY